MKRSLIIFFILLIPFFANAQQTGTISGFVTDGEGYPLDGVVIKLKGTYFGAVTGAEGYYYIDEIPPASYVLQVSALEYKTVEYTDIQITSNENREFDIVLETSSYTVDQEILVVGDRPMLDIEETASRHIITSDDISKSIVTDIKDIVSQQAGIIAQDNELHIRGGRSYENSYLIDGISVQDPLSGTGFGLQLSANMLEEVEVITGGYNAEFGQATSGVINVRTKEGRWDEYNLFVNYERDNFGVNKNSGPSFNTDVVELNLGGPEPISKYLLKSLNIPGQITFFGSFFMGISDGFYSNQTGLKASQLNSSTFGGTKFAPRQDNNWYWLGKLTWRMKDNLKLGYSFNQSVSINQNSTSLQTNLEYVEPSPGYQYNFQTILDSANTYTAQAIFHTVTWTHTTSPRTFYEIKLNRFFSRLRVDANGKNWDEYLEPLDIVKPPFSYYEIDTNSIGVIPGDGFYDLGNPFTWHDHHVEEYSVRADLTHHFTPKSKFKAGAETNFQEMQLVDIYQPWIKPMGLNNDVYTVYPAYGNTYAQHSLTFMGMIMNYGLRFDYWFPGKYVDDAVNNADIVTIPDQVRENYYDDTYNFFGRRWKGRISPRVGISHPVSTNQTLFFSYGHFNKRPRPQFVYAKLSPQSARSTFQKFGNPNLNPETTVSYELGLRNQFSHDDVLTVTAYYKNIYDYVATRSIRINSGRFIGRSFISYFNLDYARSRGIEVEYRKRIGRWFNGKFNFTYSVATGKSSSADEGFLVVSRGSQDNIIENYLSWDRPLQMSTNLYFNIEKGKGVFGFGKNILDDISIKTRIFFQSGRRFTRQLQTGILDDGRPEFTTDFNNINGEVGESWFYTDLDISKYIDVYGMDLVFSFKVLNLFNNKNSSILNPVTGRAYEFGDPTPNSWNDPLYPDLQSPISPFPFNPARFSSPRQILFGVSIKL